MNNFAGRCWHEVSYSEIPKDLPMLRWWWHAQRLLAEAQRADFGPRTTAQAVNEAQILVYREDHPTPPDLLTGA